jgi:hypothetical protein
VHHHLNNVFYIYSKFYINKDHHKLITLFLNTTLILNFNFCFKVFIYPSNGDKIALTPIVSDEIVDKKAHSDLRIVKMTDRTSQAKG